MIALRIEIHRSATRLRPPSNDTALRIGIKIRNLLRQSLGTTDVVMVEDREVLALCQIDKPVARCRDAEVSVVLQIDDPSVVVAPHHRFPIVFGTVIEQQEFEVRECLAEHTLDCLPQIALVSPVNGRQN